MLIKIVRQIQRLLQKHREFFVIFILLLLVALVTRPGADGFPATFTEIKIENLPRIYQTDTTRLKVEIMYVQPQKNKKIPSVLPVNFHTFNYDPSMGKWYLIKYDIASLLPDFTILKINPDTLWFSPWFSTAHRVPIIVSARVPSPFELISLRTDPDSLPLLYSPRDGENLSAIDLGSIRLKNSKRFQSYTFDTRKFLPKGVHTNVEKITVHAEIGQWKSEYLIKHVILENRSYLAVVYMEVPVEDKLSEAEKCIDIVRTGEGEFLASCKSIARDCRIRNLKLIGIDAID